MSGSSPAPDPSGRVVRQLARVLKWLLISMVILAAVTVVWVAFSIVNMNSAKPIEPEPKIQAAPPTLLLPPLPLPGSLKVKVIVRSIRPGR